MSDNKQKALDFFKSNADSKEVFATSDGFLFTKKADALEQAKVLNSEDPQFETFKSSTEEFVQEVLEKSKLSIAELKELKNKAVAEYTQLFNEAPNGKLSAKEIQKLIDAKNFQPDA